MKGSIEFYVVFLIVAWGLVVSLELVSVTQALERMHAYRDYVVYTVEHNNGYTETVRQEIEGARICDACTYEVTSESERLRINVQNSIVIKSLDYEAKTATFGYAYLGK